MASSVIIKQDEKWIVHEMYMNSRPSFVLPLLQEHWNSQDKADEIIRTCPLGILVILSGDEVSTYEQGVGLRDGIGMIDHNNIPGKITPMYQGRRGVLVIPSSTHETLELAENCSKNKVLFIWDGQKWDSKQREQSKPPALQKRKTVWSRSRNKQ